MRIIATYISLLTVIASPIVVVAEDQSTAVSKLRELRVPFKVAEKQLVAVDLRNQRRIDSCLTSLAGARSLEEIDFAHSLVQDVDLKQLSGFPNLNSVNLANTPITDDGLVFLAECKQLRKLNLASTKVSTTGVRKLNCLSKLERLGLAHTPILDEAICEPDSWPQLRDLDISFTKAGNETCKSLTSLKSIEKLSLASTNCTDGELRHIGKLTTLRELYLDGLPVRNVGLEHLRNVRQLTRLSVHKSNVSEEGLMFKSYCENILPPGWSRICPLEPGFDWTMWLTQGRVARIGGKEVLVFSASTQDALHEVLEDRPIEIRTVLNTPQFCVLFEDLSTEQDRRNDRQIVTLNCFFQTWLKPPRTDLPKGFLGMFEEARLEDGIAFQFPSRSFPHYKGPSHLLHVKSSGKQVIIDKETFDVTYGKKYLVIDRRGSIREVGIP